MKLVQSLATRVPRSFKRLALFAMRLGPFRGPRVMWQLSRLTRGVLPIRVPGIGVPILIRGATSDVRAFQEVFIDRDLELPFRAAPEVVLDVGAYVGYSSAYYSRAFPRATIVAVEPEASNYESLCAQTASLPNVHTIRAAVWPFPASLTVVDPDARKWSIRMRVARDGDPSVRGMTIDELLPETAYPSIDLLKLDVEGAEGYIFAEPCHWLRRVKVLSIELHERYHPGCTVIFEKAVAGMGFREYRRGANRFLVRAPA